MGKGWDAILPDPEVWAECLRVLRPGGYLLAFGGTRTYHRLTCAIEDAGFEIRDCLLWLHGQGFPKGRGCLKPAWEPIIMARKPGPKVLPLGIDECRIPIVGDVDPARKRYYQPGNGEVGSGGVYEGGYSGEYAGAEMPHSDSPRHDARGRWPANLVLSHHEECNGECHPDCPVRMLDEQSGERPSRSGATKGGTKTGYGGFGIPCTTHGYGNDTGGASRFFYCPKASRSDRGEGNTHPTVKNTALMSWLVRLVCPPGGLCLDPFAGSGTTGVACLQTGRRFIGIEKEPAYHAIAERRLKEAERADMGLFLLGD